MASHIFYVSQSKLWTVWKPILVLTIRRCYPTRCNAGFGNNPACLGFRLPDPAQSRAKLIFAVVGPCVHPSALCPVRGRSGGRHRSPMKSGPRFGIAETFDRQNPRIGPVCLPCQTVMINLIIAAAPFFHDGGVLGTTADRHRHIASHANIAADPFADIVDPALVDFALQKRIGN